MMLTDDVVKECMAVVDAVGRLKRIEDFRALPEYATIDSIGIYEDGITVTTATNQCISLTGQAAADLTQAIKNAVDDALLNAENIAKTDMQWAVNAISEKK